jgi:hypothetical protein
MRRLFTVFTRHYSHKGGRTIPKGLIWELSSLSLSGRLAVALHLFEGYCERRGLDHPELQTFVDSLWRSIGPIGPEEVKKWEAEQPPLVGAGLGWEYPSGFEEYLDSHEVPELEFRSVLCWTTEVLYGSLYGAADDQGSLRFLEALADKVEEFSVPWPDIQRFASSRWIDRSGWGNPLTSEELARWRERPA